MVNWCSSVCFLCVRACVYVCVCVCWEGVRGGEGRSGAEAPLLFYTTNIYSVLYSLAHLNNEPDITVSYFYREVPASLFYFRGSANLRTLYNILVYICPYYLFLYV